MANIVVSDNVQNENVITKRYWVSDWLTDELPDLLEWLFASNKKYFNSKPYFQILFRFLSCSLIQNVKIDKYVRSRFPSNLFDISRPTTGIKWLHNKDLVPILCSKTEKWTSCKRLENCMSKVLFPVIGVEWVLAGCNPLPPLPLPLPQYTPNTQIYKLPRHTDRAHCLPRYCLSQEKLQSTKRFFWRKIKLALLLLYIPEMVAVCDCSPLFPGITWLL